MPKPVRLQLSRRKGFNLQALSMETNGLPAVKVARRGRWGNPFNWQEGVEHGGKAWAKSLAVDFFVQWLVRPADFPREPLPPTTAEICDNLAGKNLACWCSPDEPCHADILIAVANKGMNDA